MRFPPIRGLVVAALSIMSAAGSARAQSVSYAQGTFNPADWQTVTIAQTGGFNLALSLPASGGNPGQFWQIDQTRAITGPGAGDLRVGNINTLFTYNPSTNGAVESLRFGFDLLGISSSGFNTQFFGFYRPIIQQNGALFTVLSSDVQATTNWSSFAFAFTPTSNWASVITGDLSKPDFSSAGSEIEFGWRFSGGGSCNAARCVAVSTSAGLDNFTVDVTSVVPEPSTYALMAVGLAGVLVLKRRRRSA